MVKQNSFFRGSSINVTSRGLKGAGLLTGGWFSAIKVERAARLVFLGKRGALEGGRRVHTAVPIRVKVKLRPYLVWPFLDADRVPVNAVHLHGGSSRKWYRCEDGRVQQCCDWRTISSITDISRVACYLCCYPPSCV